MDQKVADELRKLGIDPEDFDESQRDLLKSMGIDPDGSEEGDGAVSDEEVLSAVNTLRKAAGARGLDLNKALGTGTASTEEEEEAETRDDSAGRAGKVQKATGDSLPLTEGEVFSQIMKAQNGDLVQLVDGDEVLRDVVKAFSGQQAKTNAALAELKKRSNTGDALQNRALSEILKGVELQGKAFDGLIEILKGTAAFKAQTGALTDLQSLTASAPAAGSKATEAGDKTEIQKAIGEEATEPDVLDELSGSQIFGFVKKAFDDPEIRKEYGLKEQHWGEVSRRGIGILPKKFLPKLREIITESREQ